MRNLTVRDLMSTNTLAIGPDETVAVAEHRMQLAEIRHLPVIDAAAHVIGVVSSGDIARLRDKRRRRTTRVADLMSKELLVVRPETRAAEAAAAMIERKVGSLPVVGDDQELIGIVTETDFLSVARDALDRGVA